MDRIAQIRDLLGEYESAEGYLDRLKVVDIMFGSVVPALTDAVEISLLFMTEDLDKSQAIYDALEGGFNGES